MATFLLKDIVHFGIDRGIEKVEWFLSLSPDFEQTFHHSFTTGVDKTTLRYNMRIYKITINGQLYDFTNFQNGIGLYWNGHTPLYLKVRIHTFNDNIKEYTKDYMYSTKTPDGRDIPMTNPIDFTNLQKYIS